MAADDKKAIALTITTTAGLHTMNLRLEDAASVLERNAVRVIRRNVEVPLGDLTPAEVARHLATLWMNRVMKTEAACTFGLAPGKSVAIRPQTILAITGEVISPSRAVGFGSIEHEVEDAL
jgi:hypothetical protein